MAQWETHAVITGYVQHKYWYVFAPSKKLVWEAFFRDGKAIIRSNPCIGCVWGTIAKEAIEACELELAPAANPD
jgi:hypothetical protein